MNPSKKKKHVLPMYYISVTVKLPLPDGIYCIMTGRWLNERYYNNIEIIP